MYGFTEPDSRVRINIDKWHFIDSAAQNAISVYLYSFSWWLWILSNFIFLAVNLISLHSIFRSCKP